MGVVDQAHQGVADVNIGPDLDVALRNDARIRGANGSVIEIDAGQLAVGAGTGEPSFGLGQLAFGDGDFLALVVETGPGKSGRFDQPFDALQFLAAKF